MLHACIQTFDVMENLENFWELNMASIGPSVPSLLEQLLLSMLHIIRNLNARNIFDPRHMRISIQGSGIYLNRERGHR
jgi:hypothetical protein